jgi:hypothetical protein
MKKREADTNSARAWRVGVIKKGQKEAKWIGDENPVYIFPRIQPSLLVACRN